MAHYFPIYENLKPYEYIRYRVENDSNGLLGYASRFDSDGKSRWYAWTDDGLWAQARSLKAAITVIEERLQ